MKRWLNRLFYWWLFLLPWQTRLILRHGEINGQPWEYGHLGIFGTEILLWLIILLWLFTGGLRQVKSDWSNWLRQKSSRYWLAVGAVLILINVAVAEDNLLAGQQWRYWLEAAFAVYLFWRLPLVKNTALKFFLAGLVIQAALGLWQFFSQATWASRWLGLITHYPWVAGSSVLENAGGLWLRAYGGLPHPNILGGYLAAGLLLLGGLAVRRRQALSKIWWLVGAGLVCGLAVTFSRSAFLAAATGFCILLVTAADYPARQRLFKFGLAMAILAAVWIVGLWPLFSNRISASGRLENWSLVERQNSFAIAGQIISRHLWLGTGLGNYTLILSQSAKPAWMNLVSQFQPVHNVFLLWLAESGLLLFLYGWGIIWLSWRRLSIALQRKLGSALVFFLVIALFDHYLFSLYSGLMLVAVVMCFFIWLNWEYESLSSN